ncbi:Uncharacterised protein [Escherichia coli]|nr:Uncharacterised protein [Escherichia coli]
MDFDTIMEKAYEEYFELPGSGQGLSSQPEA